MEDHRKIQNSGEAKRTEDDPDFEFGSLTPSSPSQDPFSDNSPADHFFFNGRLLPHSFPSTSRTIRTISRTTSEASSGSNSTNSRSSCCSPSSYTPRTSSCSSRHSNTMSPNNRPQQLDMKPVMRSGKTVITANKSVNPKMTQPCKRRNKATEMVTAQLCGSYSQRWQYITPVPGAAFKREGSVKRGGGGGIRVGGGGRRAVVARRRKKADERRGSRVMRWWRRMLRAVVLACRECHAMEPARVVNDDVDMQRKSKFS